MAEALQDLITNNAKNNEIEDIESNDEEIQGGQDEQGADAIKVKNLETIDSYDMIAIRVATITSKTSLGHMGATQAPLQRRQGGGGG